MGKEVVSRVEEQWIQKEVVVSRGQDRNNGGAGGNKQIESNSKGEKMSERGGWVAKADISSLT